VALSTAGSSGRATRVVYHDAPARGKRPTKAHVVRAIERVAAQLGNTPAISRKCYVHPAVLEAYRAGLTIEPPADGDAEAVVLAFLGRRLARAAPERRAA